MNDIETRAYNSGTSGLNRLVPVLRRHGLHETADGLEVMVAKLKVTIPMIRDVERLAKEGCCCGELTGKRTNRPLCEACDERERGRKRA